MATADFCSRDTQVKMVVAPEMGTVTSQPGSGRADTSKIDCAFVSHSETSFSRLDSCSVPRIFNGCLL